MHSYSTRAVALLIAANDSYTRLLRDAVKECELANQPETARAVFVALLQETLEIEAETLGVAGRDHVAVARIFQLIFAAANDADWVFIVGFLVTLDAQNGGIVFAG